MNKSLFLNTFDMPIKLLQVLLITQLLFVQFPLTMVTAIGGQYIDSVQLDDFDPDDILANVLQKSAFEYYSSDNYFYNATKISNFWLIPHQRAPPCFS